MIKSPISRSLKYYSETLFFDYHLISVPIKKRVKQLLHLKLER